MTTRRAWPQRYRVRIHLRSGGSAAYPVVTWLGVEKAIALAVAAHVRRRPDAESQPYDVEVEDLGPVAKDDAGKMLLEGNDLTDRAEF